MRETAGQTAGPYVHIGCTPHETGIRDVYDADLGASPIEDGAKGQLIEISGKVMDGEGTPLFDGMIETWQADSVGLYSGQSGADPKVSGWARIALDKNGAFNLQTVKPGRTPNQMPHISLWLVARGLNKGLQTRIYFGDEDNDQDLILSKVAADRRKTLVTTLTSPNIHRFDIHLQGEAETVFLEI